MHALPWQNNINLHREKLLQISVLSLKGEELQRSLPPEGELDLGNAGGDRASPSLSRPPDPWAIPVISIATVPQQ